MNNPPKEGKEAFENHYRSYFENEKTFELFIENLKKHSKPVLRFHPANEEKLKTLFAEKNIPWKILSWHKYALIWPDGFEVGMEIPGFKENLFYIQNASSLLPVITLDVNTGHKTLDAAAAPGGKALFISQHLSEKDELHLNDPSQQRVKRLRQVFKDFHADIMPIFHSQNGATLFKKYPLYFDRILLDAPCSSEKHVYNYEKHLKIWRYGRIKQLKFLQQSLINGLFLALKPGGRMVYSTCAVNPEENEQVIAKFLKKYKDAAALVPFPENLPGFQKDSPFGRIDITDPQNENMDPMFIAIIERVDKI